MATTLLSKAEQYADKTEVITSIFSEADTVLTGRPVTVGVVLSENNAPAWSNESHVVLNSRYVDFTTMDGLVEATGLNYHEIGHILFTPGFGDSPTHWARRENKFQAYNILEDQRLETFLSVMYPSVIPYFTTIVVKWIVNGEQTTAFPYLHGRRYLSQKIRDGVRAKYKDQAVVAEIAAIIDEYVTLTFPERSGRAIELIKRFDELVMPHGDNEPFGHNEQSDAAGEGDPHSYGRAVLSEEQIKQVAEQVKQQIQSGQVEQRTADGDTEQTQSTQQVDDRLREAIEQALSEVEQDSSVQQNLNDIKRKIEKGKPDKVERLDPTRYRKTQVDASTLAASRRLSTALMRLQTEVDPGWDTHKPSGRFNVQRAIEGSEFSELFDQWNEGNNLALSMEVVILLDVSGSMRPRLWSATQTMWAIKRAFEKLSAQTSVIIYSEGSEYLYRRGEKATNDVRYVDSRGSTFLTDALHESARLFHYSDKHVKYLFVVTDGIWHDSAGAEQYIDQLNRNDVITTVVYLAHASREGVDAAQTEAAYRHHAHIFHPITDITDLVNIVRALVVQTTRARKTR